MDGWEDLQDRWAAEAVRELMEGDRLATPAEAHLEWHRNAEVPLGQPCPMDACDPYYDEPYDEETQKVEE